MLRAFLLSFGPPRPRKQSDGLDGKGLGHLESISHERLEMHFKDSSPSSHSEDAGI